MTDAPDVDFDALNETASSNALSEKFKASDQQSQGLETRDISAGAAYRYFRDQQTSQYLYEPDAAAQEIEE